MAAMNNVTTYDSFEWYKCQGQVSMNRAESAAQINHPLQAIRPTPTAKRAS
jgi:hypothetical protein